MVILFFSVLEMSSGVIALALVRVVAVWAGLLTHDTAKSKTARGRIARRQAAAKNLIELTSGEQ
jgi:hypothetical protein